MARGRWALGLVPMTNQKSTGVWAGEVRGTHAAFCHELLAESGIELETPLRRWEPGRSGAGQALWGRLPRSRREEALHRLEAYSPRISVL